MDAPFQNPGGNMRDPAPSYVAKIVQSKANSQIEFMHVPGGMIIYRTCFHNTTPFHTAVYVPIHDPENYPWWFNKWFPTKED